jgi:hypothetical protein
MAMELTVKRLPILISRNTRERLGVFAASLKTAALKLLW